MKKPIAAFVAALASLAAGAQTAPQASAPAPAPFPFNITYGDVAHVLSAKPVTESDRVIGYDVAYEYNGHQFNIRMPYDPGKEMPVNVDVHPPMPRPPARAGYQNPQGPQAPAGPQPPHYRGT